MDLNRLISQLQAIEAQLAALRAELEKEAAPSRPKSLGDLYGIWAGLSNSSEEDIEAVKYRFKWEGEELGAD